MITTAKAKTLQTIKQMYLLEYKSITLNPHWEFWSSERDFNMVS